MATTTPAIMGPFGPSFFDTSSTVGSPGIFVTTELVIFDVPASVGPRVGSVGKIDNLVIYY